MIEILKSLFGKEKENEPVPDLPGRTFNRILTGRYFGCEDTDADETLVAKAKQEKIAQIDELGLIPMFIRYAYEDTNKNKRGLQAEENHPDQEISSVHVVFQKEVLGNMIHITEISFIVNRSDFNEFEKMSGTSLKDDFRDLSSSVHNEEERRKVKRESLQELSMPVIQRPISLS